MTNKETRYNVYCEKCNQIWQPVVHSTLWWKAYKRSEEGFLDAYCATHIEHGCEQEISHPEAPFRVFGFTDDCQDFDIPLYSFSEAIKAFKRHRDSCTIFIEGVSQRVQNYLQYGH